MGMTGAGIGLEMGGTILGFLSAGDRKKAINELNKKYPALNLGQIQGDAIASNQAALPGAERLASEVNTFTSDQLNKQLEAIMPGYSALQKSVTGAISDEVSGKLPKDVLDFLKNQAASYGVSSGTVGSESSGYRGLRNLGLTSLQVAQHGISSAMAWMSKADALARGTMFNVSSMFFTPEQYYQGTAMERNLKYERELGAWAVPTAQEYMSQAMIAEGGQMMGSGGGFSGVASSYGFGGGGGGGFDIPANTSWIGGSAINNYGLGSSMF